ncbi:MAG: DUF3025 domain-containing protein [Pseudomonadota bacterium]|nr:DUF3025 domain-containing protein [Pseudomonadota bacterium]
MKFEAPAHWTTDFLHHGIFDDLNALFNLTQFSNWPTLDWLNSLAINITNRNNQQISFVANDDVDWQHGYYEEIIFDKGEIPTRLENWHDLFGAFIWLLFPKTKALLNQLHIEQINKHGKTERSKKRNAITLLDECGVLVVCDQAQADLLKNHLWIEGFYNQREQWHSTSYPFMFGHANYEMATRPYLGLTGKALYITVEHQLMPKCLKDRYAWLDSYLENLIENEDILCDNSSLFPLPLLGVPNWYEQNKEKAFYENTDYFRPKRRKLK